MQACGLLWLRQRGWASRWQYEASAKACCANILFSPHSILMLPPCRLCQSTLEHLKHYFKMGDEGRTDKGRSSCLVDFAFLYLFPEHQQW